ncbi:MAG: hypothetical protein JWM82_3367, partial [Myxococcales bacterium]|nr:hypothetical protein [Myxococcales bacterium]
ARVADVAFVVGAVGAVAAGYLLFGRPRPAAPTASARLHVSPVVTNESASLAFSGAW